MSQKKVSEPAQAGILSWRHFSCPHCTEKAIILDSGHFQKGRDLPYGKLFLKCAAGYSFVWRHVSTTGYILSNHNQIKLTEKIPAP